MDGKFELWRTRCNLRPYSTASQNCFQTGQQFSFRINDSLYVERATPMISQIDDHKCGEVCSVPFSYELKICIVWFQNSYQEIAFRTELLSTLI